MQDLEEGSNVICLYHKDCFDGMGAAWAILQRFPKGDFRAVDYKDPIPDDLVGKHVIIVDFSYELPIMQRIISEAAYVTFLDHHVRSREICDRLNEADYPNVTAIFEMKKSGATMAWEHFHPDRECPCILKHIADRDLWQFEMEGTESIMSGMGIYPLDLIAWNNILTPVDHWNPKQNFDFLLNLQKYGEIIKIKNKTDVVRIIDQTLRYITFVGIPNIPMINVPRSIGSEALSLLAEDEKHEFSIGYFDTNSHRVFSMRSRSGGRFVNELARFYGGDGHHHAAGFSVPRTHELAML